MMNRKHIKALLLLGVMLLGLVISGCAPGQETKGEFNTKPSETEIGLDPTVSKITKVEDVDQYLDETFDRNETEQFESWSGIEVWIFCDYTKHNDYEKWIEQYDLKGTYDSAREKYLDDYFDLLNTACYELLSDYFPNGNFTSICTGEFLYFTYSSQVELDKDYDNITKLCEEDYVLRIVIQETEGMTNVDE